MVRAVLFRDVMRLRNVLLVCAALASSSAGCASCAQSYLGIMPGTINDPSNRTLRREILSYGIGQFCTELMKHSAPLKLADDQPAIGRFFPSSCDAKKLPDGDLQVTLGGDGYAWTNLSKKVTFDMTGTIEYDQDFQLDGSTMYAYFRTKRITKSDFKSKAIENPIANIVTKSSTFGTIPYSQTNAFQPKHDANALVRVDVVLRRVVRGVDAIYRANVDAGRVFHADARLGDDIRHAIPLVLP